jgi:hypothetical protein
LVDIETDEVSLVDRAANKKRFLVVKRASAKSGDDKMPDLTMSKGHKERALKGLTDGLEALTALVETVRGAAEVDVAVPVWPSALTDGVLGLAKSLLSSAHPNVEQTPAVTEAAKTIADEIAKTEPPAMFKSAGDEAKDLAEKIDAVDGAIAPELADAVKGLLVKIEAAAVKATLDVTKIDAPIDPKLPINVVKASGVASRILREVADHSWWLGNEMLQGSGKAPSEATMKTLSQVVRMMRGLVDKAPSITKSAEVPAAAAPATVPTADATPAAVVAAPAVVAAVPAVAPVATPDPVIASQIEKILAANTALQARVGALTDELATISKRVPPPASRSEVATPADNADLKFPQNYNDPNYREQLQKRGLELGY